MPSKSTIWRRNNPEKAKAQIYKHNRSLSHKRSRRKHHLKITYGLSLEQYDNMCNAQGNRCGICRELGHKLYVDHNHKNNKVRGLLCNVCNKKLGVIENKDFLEKAITYLNIFNESSIHE